MPHLDLIKAQKIHLECVRVCSLVYFMDRKEIGTGIKLRVIVPH